MKNNKEIKLIVSFEPEETFEQDFADFVQVILERDSNENENEDEKLAKTK